MKEMEKIFLLMGTNFGDLKSNLTEALQRLAKNGILVLKKSKIYKTKSWGKINQPDFLNMALEVQCNYEPTELLHVLKKIESNMGRKNNSPRWGSRIIDIDIVFYGDRVMKKEDLIIPHKEFYNRPFALKLLAEIAPAFIPPNSDKPLKEYLKGINNEGIEIYCN
jgi:2-amino-4-hydroxy-6-hydroxymethyldihydropteridine diphosphokinase